MINTIPLIEASADKFCTNSCKEESNSTTEASERVGQPGKEAVCEHVWSVWQEHAQPLRQFLQQRTREHSLTDDLLSEVLLKTYKNCNKLPTVHNVRGWLVRIAQHSLTDHYRKGKVEDLPPADVLPATSDDLLPEQQLAACLGELLILLPEADRLPLQWSDLEGLPQLEVAKRLGISLSGAKSRIQRARIKLREQLEECCSIETDARGRIIDYFAKKSC